MDPVPGIPPTAGYGDVPPGVTNPPISLAIRKHLRRERRHTTAKKVVQRSPMGVIEELRVDGHPIGKFVVTRRQVQHVGHAREIFRTGIDNGEGNGKQPHNLLRRDFGHKIKF